MNKYSRTQERLYIATELQGKASSHIQKLFPFHYIRSCILRNVASEYEYIYAVLKNKMLINLGKQTDHCNVKILITKGTLIVKRVINTQAFLHHPNCNFSTDFACRDLNVITSYYLLGAIYYILIELTFTIVIYFLCDLI